MTSLVGGIEAGGTKFLCALGTGPDDLRETARFPTTTPELTIRRAVSFFQDQRARGLDPEAIGIASFGPVDPDPGSSTWGFITSTPKPGWADTDLAGGIGGALGVPVAFDTDTNGAGLGEWRHGAARGLDDFIYLTVGTGIGGGGLAGGRPMRGLVHPEMGHVLIPHDRVADPYPGGCPFHGDCLEGLASGPAMRERWGRPAEELPADHPGWALEARYLALGIVNFICTLSPRRVVIGGGVMAHAQLLPAIRHDVVELLHGYVRSPALIDEIDSYIVAPALGDRAGIVGAIELAHRCLADGEPRPRD